MALKLSTGLRNFLAGGGSIRKAFEDAVLYIYSGTAPASADAAPTGTLLCKITKSSGSVSSGDRSTPQMGKIVIGSHAGGETFIIDVTVDGVGPTSYTYTNTPDAGGVDDVALKVAQMLNDIPQLQAVAIGTGGEIYVEHRIAGGSFTIAKNSGSTGTFTVTSEVRAASVKNTLKFGLPDDGVIAKNDDIWSGVASNSGTAGYFRLVTSSDSLLASETDYRIQGNVSTSGAELNMSSISIVSGATQTIDTFELTIPAS